MSSERCLVVGLIAWGLAALVPACSDDSGDDAGAGASTGGASSSSGGGSGVDGSTGSTSGEASTGSTAADATDSGGTSEGSTSEGGEETSIPEVGFDQILELMTVECFCHRSAMPSGGLDLRDAAAYASIVSIPSVEAPGVDRVSPGDPSQSYLYLKVIGEQASVGGSGVRMPAGMLPLPPEDIDLIRFWILGGAQP